MKERPIPLQQDMFTGELVDTRSRRQKRRDRERELPQQAEMFSQAEMAQFGVNANPKMPLALKTRLELAAEDPRTEEEREEDRWRQAERQTYQMFAEEKQEASPSVLRDDGMD